MTDSIESKPISEETEKAFNEDMKGRPEGTAQAFHSGIEEIIQTVHQAFMAQFRLEAVKTEELAPDLVMTQFWTAITAVSGNLPAMLCQDIMILNVREQAGGNPMDVHERLEQVTEQIKQTLDLQLKTIQAQIENGEYDGGTSPTDPIDNRDG